MTSQTPSGRRMIEMTLIGVVGSAVFAASVTASGSVIGDLASFIPLAGEAKSSTGATAAMLVDGALAGAATSNVSCAGSLRAEKALAGSAQGGCSAAATLVIAGSGLGALKLATSSSNLLLAGGGRLLLAQG